MDLFGGLSLGSVVDSFKQSTSNSMQNVKDNTLTPVDITTSNLSQGVAKKTARDTGVASVITDYRSEAVESLDGIIGAVSGGLLNTMDITKALRVGPDGVTFSTDALLSSASGELGFPVSGQSGAMRKLASSISKEFGDLTGIPMPSVITSDGTGIGVNKNWRSQIGSQVLKTVGRMSGLGEFFDSSVKSAVYNTILKSAVEYGMTDTYKSLYSKYPSSLAYARQDAVLSAIQIAITKGDIKSLDALIALIDVNSRTTILSKYPTFVESLFSKFKFADDVYPNDYPALLTKLLAILQDVAGDEWWLKTTNFGKVYNVTIIHKASADMITLLRGFDEVVPLLCCAGIFNANNAISTLKSAFPNAPQYASNGSATF